MSKTYEEMLATFSPEDQAEIKAETEKLKSELKRYALAVDCGLELVESYEKEIAELKAENDEGLKSAARLATLLHKAHFPNILGWKPLDTISGVINQIDNMTVEMKVD